MITTYSQKLKDPRWQKKRLKVMEYAKWRCQACGAKNSTLHVHHSYYTKGKEPWQYPDGSLICICGTCHGLLHPDKVACAVLNDPPMVPQDTVDWRDDSQSIKDRMVAYTRERRPLITAWLQECSSIELQGGDLVVISFPVPGLAYDAINRPLNRQFLERAATDIIRRQTCVVVISEGGGF